MHDRVNVSLDWNKILIIYCCLYNPNIRLAIAKNDELLSCLVKLSQFRRCSTVRLKGKTAKFEYLVYEKDPRVVKQGWGGYTRHNQIWRRSDVFSNG